MISIILPCYNVGRTIGRCLESILLQTYEDYEIIIVDYGSTDETKNVIDSVLANTNKPYHYHYMQNYGKNAALNYGIAQASGEYLFFINGHDFLNQNILQFLYQGLITSQTDFIVCDYRESSYRTREVNVYRTPSDVYVNKFTPDEYITKTCKAVVHSDVRFYRIWGKLYKKELFDDYRLTDDIGSEISLMHSLILKSSQIGTMSYVLYFRTTPPKVPMDMTIAQAYQERIDYLKRRVKKYGAKVILNAYYQYVMALLDIFRYNTNHAVKTDCVTMVNDIIKQYPKCMTKDAVMAYIKKISKNVLTK